MHKHLASLMIGAFLLQGCANLQSSSAAMSRGIVEGVSQQLQVELKQESQALHAILDEQVESLEAGNMSGEEKARFLAALSALNDSLKALNQGATHQELHKITLQLEALGILIEGFGVHTQALISRVENALAKDQDWQAELLELEHILARQRAAVGKSLDAQRMAFTQSSKELMDYAAQSLAGSAVTILFGLAFAVLLLWVPPFMLGWWMGKRRVQAV